MLQWRQYVWSSKARALDYLERNEEAIQVYDKALAVDPNDAMVRREKGTVFYSLARYEEAIQEYDRALAIDPTPKYASVWTNRASALLNLERYEDAIQAYDAALAMDSKNAFTWPPIIGGHNQVPLKQDSTAKRGKWLSKEKRMQWLKPRVLQSIPPRPEFRCAPWQMIRL